jgi:hypothetical protein
MTFRTLEDAIRNGFQSFDRTADGYLVRMRTARGWVMALVVGERR